MAACDGSAAADELGERPPDEVVRVLPDFLEVLQWLAAGKSQQDVADILNISTRTVEVHVRSSREKLVALTTSQAVGRAIGMNLIFPG